jgi:hypothetical protein
MEKLMEKQGKSPINHGKIIGKPGKIIGKPGKIIGKSTENDGTIVETMGKSWENHRRKCGIFPPSLIPEGVRKL